jgi:hypothetical protein
VGGVESEVRSVDVGAAGRKEVAVARCVYLGAVRDVRVVTNRGGLSQIAAGCHKSHWRQQSAEPSLCESRKCENVTWRFARRVLAPRGPVILREALL